MCRFASNKVAMRVKRGIRVAVLAAVLTSNLWSPPQAGVPITFVLVNEDPIDHEWLIGDDAFHEAHRTGTHASHDAVPTEVTVPALETVRTTITFEEPGTLSYICHLPQHESYGMVGVLTVEG